MSLETMSQRLQYQGGFRQQSRMIEDKLRSLKKALLYSYQSETAILKDGREFRCLINKDSLNQDYDNKIISIPFKDICLNEERIGTTTMGQQEIGMKVGDVFEWKETNSYWIVYLQRLEELAYFRAEIRRCRYEIEINGEKYKVYFRGPTEQMIDWNLKERVDWNDLNYSGLLLITADSNTTEYFKRFAKIKINGKNWEVQVVDNMTTEGVIFVYVKEDYSNTIEDKAKALELSLSKEEPEIDKTKPYIEGNSEVHPYDTEAYVAKNTSGGKWFIDNNKARIISQQDNVVYIEIVSGKSGSFNLLYQKENEEDILFPIKIMSL